MWLLSGEDGEFIGAFESELLAEQAAWEYSERDCFGKEQTIDYMESNTSVDHIKDVYRWSYEKWSLCPASCLALNETEEYALKNYRSKLQAVGG